MREQIQKLSNMGPLPDEQASIELIKAYEDLLLDIAIPVTDEEAVALVKLFGPDGCYGLALHLVYLIETAPGWPIEQSLRDKSKYWINFLNERVDNARKSGKLK